MKNNKMFKIASIISTGKLYTLDDYIYDHDLEYLPSIIKRCTDKNVLYIQKYVENRNFINVISDEEYLNSLKNADCVISLLENVEEDDLVINIVPTQIKNRDARYYQLLQKYKFLGFKECILLGDDGKEYNLMIYINNDAGKKYFTKMIEKLQEDLEKELEDEKLYNEINQLEQNLYDTAVNFVDTLLLLIRKTNKIKK